MEAERDEGVKGRWWVGALVTRDDAFTGGVGRVISEPDDQGIAWVYWGAGDHGKYESREVVTEMVRLDLDAGFMRTYRRSGE